MGGYSFRILYREEVHRRGIFASKIHDLITFLSITCYWWMTKCATNFDQEADRCRHDIFPCSDWEPNRYVKKTFSKEPFCRFVSPTKTRTCTIKSYNPKMGVRGVDGVETISEDQDWRVENRNHLCDFGKSTKNNVTRIICSIRATSSLFAPIATVIKSLFSISVQKQRCSSEGTS